MDLNEYSKIQCFNCHEDIIFTSVHEDTIQPLGPVCEECLHRQSNEIQAMQAQNQILEKELGAFKNGFKEQVVHYSRHLTESTATVQELDQKLKKVIVQSYQLQQQEQLKNNQFMDLINQIVEIESVLEKQSSFLNIKQISFASQIEESMHLSYQITDLQMKKDQLQKISILSQLYTIHFDDNFAYINQQPITHHTSKFLVEILIHLMSKYQYKGFTVNFMENYIQSVERIKLHTHQPEATIPWLTFLAKETIFIWQQMKQQASGLTHQSYESYTLPFKISPQPQLSISELVLTPGPTYPSFLRYYTHNIKFMMNFDFSVELRQAMKNRKSES